MATTPLTLRRERVLSAILHDIEADRCASFRRDPAILRMFQELSPKRRPAWEDMVGRAFCSVRDWLAGEFDAPHAATVREIKAALAAPLPTSRRAK